MTIQETSNKVREFMEMTDNTLSSSPNNLACPDRSPESLANMRTTDLCVNLIKEEMTEMTHGIFRCDLEQTLDGAADSLFVILFALHKMGIADKLDAMMEEVCRSNMTKLWTGEEVDIALMSSDFGNDYEVTLVKDRAGDLKVTRAWLVKRRSDGKVIKSPSYSPANAKGILEGRV